MTRKGYSSTWYSGHESLHNPLKELELKPDLHVDHAVSRRPCNLMSELEVPNPFRRYHCLPYHGRYH
jgi:hypothetical protein